MTDMGETLDESGKTKKNFRCLKCDRLISFLANSGWTNSHGHLERCYGRKDLLVRTFLLNTLAHTLSISTNIAFFYNTGNERTSKTEQC